MSDNTEFKIKIEGAGLTLERDVSREIGEQIVVLVLSGGATARTTLPGQPSTTDAQQVHHTESSLSAREFLDKYSPKSNPEKITTLGLYLKLHHHKNGFAKEDVLAAFVDAAESEPKNYSRDIKAAVKSGWVATKPGSGDVYFVTNKGQIEVERSFASPTKKVSGKKK